MRDFAHVFNNGLISLDVAKDGLKRLEIDNSGLDANDRRLLLTIIEKYDGGPVGVETLAAATSEEKDTIEDVIEPFLIYKGFIKKTPRGRVASKLTYEHLGISYSPKTATIEEFLEDM